MMSWFAKVFWLGVLALLALPMTPAIAFHKDIYEPRVPEPLLEELQDMDNPFSPTPENIEEGRQIFLGKGYCVLCHGKNGKGVKIPGHKPRDFTNAKWQEVRTDGEMMWALKNGSPGTGMPVRVGRVINEEEGWKTILFIRTLSEE
ncbi:MAG: cytochrome c [Nitrospinae bacterium]|jgi:mono/diheme cytochrome c family protein|nr:cytochrome c [Nitrospinota bacterium]